MIVGVKSEEPKANIVPPLQLPLPTQPDEQKYKETTITIKKDQEPEQKK